VSVPRPLIAAALLAAIFAVIYQPALGHGFVKDDFHWIAAAAVRTPADIVRIFASNTGFYRPLVTLSFALDFAIWALNPRGFAFTNLLLLVIDAALLFRLGRLLALPAAGALFAAAVWAFNFHGINMALLWTSGRTALLLCAFTLATVIAFVRGRSLLAGALAFAAMLCKEEAVMLPPLFLAIELTDRRNPRGALMSVWPAWVALLAYAALRLHSGAFGPLTAPEYYRLSLDPRVLIENAFEYLDRGVAWPLIAAAVVAFAVPRRPPFDATEWRAIRIGALWFVAMYAITVLIVVRSSLYAVAPSIGSALVAGTLAARSWRADARRFSFAATALIIAVAAAVPVYRLRNDGFVAPADLSATSLNTIHSAVDAHAPVDRIVLVDDPQAEVTLEDAFGALFPDAVHLFIGPRRTGAIVGSRAAAPSAAPATRVFELRNGVLVQLP
jgi:hypothetical protein